MAAFRECVQTGNDELKSVCHLSPKGAAHLEGLVLHMKALCAPCDACMHVCMSSISALYNVRAGANLCIFTQSSATHRLHPAALLQV